MPSPRVLVFIPAYRCADQIGRVVAQLTGPIRPHVAEVVVVDNRSPDDTLERAIAALEQLPPDLPWAALRNDDNYGLGGSHKVAIQHGLQHGFDWVLVLHGDDQALADDAVQPIVDGGLQRHDALLGARFMRSSRLLGYSRVRTVGNHVYNVLFSLAARRRMHDLGSGLNLFRLDRFRDGAHRRFADDLTFNYHLSLWMAWQGWPASFFPISWREEDQRSNVKLVEQGMRVLRLLADFRRDPERFFAQDHSVPGAQYTATVVASSAGQ